MTPTVENTERWVTVDGHELRYHEAGSGAPLVLLHGSGAGVSGWANFGNNLPVLAEHFRCLILDQPGFGASGRPEVYERNYLRIAADAVLGLLDELGIEKAHLLGNSMGGGVAALLALDHPDRVDRVVLMAPGGVGVNVLGPEPSEGIRRLMEYNANPSDERAMGFLRAMVCNEATLTEELVATRLKAAADPRGQAALRDAYATFYNPKMAEPLPLWARLKSLRHEVLMLWGQDDRVTPVEGALFPARQLPNADLRIFSRCGHWVMVERKDAFERAVIEFLENGL
ncbi:alpha/beta fold hydrolase [Nocardia sp. NBC_01503]|uniref:alpha/beta fold hydrolase n=1 Tax=Nocardia sp. NBC_01503 TaxID=2975997 RepID=UPI002E7B0066|nr:alpha/beta fold hydrolase [Nocardia sp. NBC_01503]WTL33123.1 alpha/beta fold hydrolase [Nocardia sp. NBC_01503]